MERSLERLLSLSDCERTTGRKVATWRKDIRLRKVPFVRLGRQIRIAESTVVKMIEAGRVPAIPMGGRR